MIDNDYRKASEAVDDALNYAQNLIIAAWNLAGELDNRNTRHGNALLGLLSMAEDRLEEGMKAQEAAWNVARKHSGFVDIRPDKSNEAA